MFFSLVCGRRLHISGLGGSDASSWAEGAEGSGFKGDRIGSSALPSLGGRNGATSDSRAYSLASGLIWPPSDRGAVVAGERVSNSRGLLAAVVVV